MAIIYTSDGPVELYYVLLAGKNIKLAQVEVESILNLVSKNFETRWYSRLGLISCSPNPIPILLHRAALVREIGNVLVEDQHYSSLIDKLTRNVVQPDIDRRSFSISVHDIDKSFPHGEKHRLAESLGKMIQDITGSSVSLRKPDVPLSVVTTKDVSILGKTHKSSQRKLLEQRRPSKKPFFHPSMMNSILARVMCNIAEISSGDVILDPFCGGGSILCEASLIGARIVGIDLNWKLLKGAKENLLYQDTHDFTLVQGDSKYLPVEHLDCIITDPPYGRTSSTRGSEASALVESLLTHIRDSKDSLVLCLCANQDMQLRNAFPKYGLSVEHSVTIPVHSGLTREIFKVRT
ncbi:MAG: DNA methyltransferase [Candidatus Thorarchaeota archaeon]